MEIIHSFLRVCCDYKLSLSVKWLLIENILRTFCVGLEAEALPSSAPEWTCTQPWLALQDEEWGCKLTGVEFHINTRDMCRGSAAGRSNPRPVWWMASLITAICLWFVSLEVSDEILFCTVANAPRLAVSSSTRAALWRSAAATKIPAERESDTEGESHVLWMLAYTMAGKSRPIVTRPRWKQLPAFLET